MTDLPSEFTVRKWSVPVFMTEEQIAEAQSMRDMVTSYFATVTDPDYVPPPRWEGPPVTPVPDAYAQLLAEFPADRTGYVDALFTVVELHAPKPNLVYPDGTVNRWQCEGCDVSGYEWEYPDWPCETTAVIGRHLGVEVTG